MSSSLDRGATARAKHAYPGDNFPGESSSQKQQISQSPGYPPVPKDDYLRFPCTFQHSLPSQENSSKTDFPPPSSQISDQPLGLHPFYGVPNQPLQKSEQQLPSVHALPLPQTPPKSNYHPPSFQTTDHSQSLLQGPSNGIPSQGYSTHDQSHRNTNHPQQQQQLSSLQVHHLKQNPGKNSHHPLTSRNQTSQQPQKQQPPIGFPSEDHPPKDKQPSREKKSSNQTQQQLPSALPDSKDDVIVPSSLNTGQPASVGSAFPTQGNNPKQEIPTLPEDPRSQPQRHEFPMQNYAGVNAQAKGRGAEPVIAFPDPSCLQENLNQLTMYVQSKQLYSINAQENNQLPQAGPPPKRSCCSIL